MISCCWMSDSAPCISSTWPSLVRPSRPGSVLRSHSRVGTLSENTTARVALYGPTPISFSFATRAVSLAESSSVTWSASAARRVSAARSVWSPVFFARLRAVTASALWLERKAFSSV